jgi:hypothetical protein
MCHHHHRRGTYVRVCGGLCEDDLAWKLGIDSVAMAMHAQETGSKRKRSAGCSEGVRTTTVLLLPQEERWVPLK